MTTSYVSLKTKIAAARAFKDSFKESVPKRIGYIFLSKSSPYPDENVAPDMVDTVSQEKDSWDNMILGKRVIPKDIELVIPRQDWIPGARYKQYDDKADLESLLTPDYSDGEPIYPMYVINTEGNVYKCISNNAGAISIIEPTGTYTENDGFIQTDLDGEPEYLWKYMYNVRTSDKFLSAFWIPVPYIQANTDYTEYNFSTSNLIDGSLCKIEMSNTGSGYFHTTLNVESFSAGTNTLNIIDNIDLSTSNTIKVNMLVSGNGLGSGTYITTINPSNPTTLYLSTDTISSGGGNNSTNRISVKTRVSIDGDGVGGETSVKLTGNSISHIDVTNIGTGYTRANVTIYGSGSDANARVILPPKFGHGYNPAVELGATSVIILSRIGEIDATENNKIPVDIEFRQYGLLINPYKYDEVDVISEYTANTIVSQTTDLELISLSNFTVNEMVYQGNINDPSFVGYVVYQDVNNVHLNNVYKTPTVGGQLIGFTSGQQNVVVSVKNPDLKPYVGDILYGKNTTKVERSVAQSEEVKLVFKF